jgi:sulfur relay (sulfurtransferase) DsrC/TusE family protein
MQARLANQETDMKEDDPHIWTHYYDRRVAFVNNFYVWYGSVGAIYLVIEKEQKKKHNTTKKNKKYIVIAVPSEPFYLIG